MKHLKTYENQEFDPEMDFMDRDVKRLYHIFCETGGLFKVEKIDRRVIFRKVQEEFDEGEGELESIYKVWIPDDKLVLGVVEAYGPNHALVKCAIQQQNQYIIHRTSIKGQKVSEKHLKQSIQDAKDLLEMWTNVE
jgi:hypothetical protein